MGTKRTTKEGSVMNGWTKESVLRKCAEIRAMARVMFEEDGACGVVTFFFASREGSNGLVEVPQRVGMGKDEYAFMLRMVGADPDVSGSLVLFEGWHADLGRNPSAKEIARWAGRIHEHPNRQESVCTILDHQRAGKASWRAEITRDSEDRATLAPWREEPQVAEERGRFVGLVPATN